MRSALIKTRCAQGRMIRFIFFLHPFVKHPLAVGKSAPPLLIRTLSSASPYSLSFATIRRSTRSGTLGTASLP